MKKYVWCEDSKSGYQFWKVMFRELYPDIAVETKYNSSRLCESAAKIKEDENFYYIIIDMALDNPNVARELKWLKKTISGKTNIALIKMHSFEFSLLSFEFLEQWIFAEKDALKDKREKLLEARKEFIRLVNNGGNASDLAEFKNLYDFQENKNQEKIAAKLLFEITRNTGFETNKSKVGECFINSCCEWNDRQLDDICGLDSSKLIISDKMEQLIKNSVLRTAFEEAGL